MTLTLKNMYPIIRESQVAKITGALTTTSTTIPVDNINVFPEAPNLATIFDRYGVSRETVRYSGKTANSLTGIIRAYEGRTTAQPWVVGSDITRALSSYDHDTFKDNIETLKNEIENLDIDDTVLQEIRDRIDDIEQTLDDLSLEGITWGGW